MQHHPAITKKMSPTFWQRRTGLSVRTSPLGWVGNAKATAVALAGARGNCNTFSSADGSRESFDKSEAGNYTASAAFARCPQVAPTN